MSKRRTKATAVSRGRSVVISQKSTRIRRRLASWAVDAVCVFVAAFITQVITNQVTIHIIGSHTINAFVLVGLMALGGFVYLGTMYRCWGRTVGQMTAKIVLRGEQGQAVRWYLLLGRSFLNGAMMMLGLWPINLLWLIRRDRRLLTECVTRTRAIDFVPR